MIPGKRPDTAAYPQIYRNFKGKPKDGKCRNYWIQDLTDEYKEEVLRYYIELFLIDEPACLCSGIKDDPLGVEEMRQIWKDKLSLNTSLICLTKDENGDIKIAGFNTLYIQSKDAEKKEMKSESTKKLITVMSYFETSKDPFTEFKCDQFIAGLGLYVMPEYRKEGIGEKLLSTRDELCKLLNIKLSITYYSNPGSYIPAARAGFKDYISITYENLGKIDKKFELPGIQKYSIDGKSMYKLYN